MWLNNLTENISTEKKAIVTLESFIERQNEIQKQVEAGVIKWWQHMLFLEKLLDFQKALIMFYGKNIDPIEYIHNLYFKENQSVESISKTCQSIFEKSHITQNIFKTSSAIQKFIKYRLHWELKNQHENKNTIVYKTRTATQKILEPVLERKQQRIERFYDWFEQNTKPNIANYHREYLENLKYNYQKFLYLLVEVFQVSKENFLKLPDEVNIWNQSIADRWNEVFTRYGIPYQFSHKDITRVLNKLTSQN